MTKESQLERVVTLVWHSFGIIGNGGFQYLFEGSFNGDPDFVYTAAAFRRIGCRQAAEAFEQALSLFPGNHPPDDIEARLRIYESVPEQIRHQIDCKFWDADSDLKAKLAAFIRAHAEALERQMVVDLVGLDDRYDVLGDKFDDIGQQLAARVAVELGPGVRVTYGPQGGWCRRLGRGQALVVQE